MTGVAGPFAGRLLFVTPGRAPRGVTSDEWPTCRPPAPVPIPECGKASPASGLGDPVRPTRLERLVKHLTFHYFPASRAGEPSMKTKRWLVVSLESRRLLSAITGTAMQDSDGDGVG